MDLALIMEDPVRVLFSFWSGSMSKHGDSKIADDYISTILVAVEILGFVAEVALKSPACLWKEDGRLQLSGDEPRNLSL